MSKRRGAWEQVTCYEWTWRNFACGAGACSSPSSTTDNGALVPSVGGERITHLVAVVYAIAISTQQRLPSMSATFPSPPPVSTDYGRRDLDWASLSCPTWVGPVSSSPASPLGISMVPAQAVFQPHEDNSRRSLVRIALTRPYRHLMLPTTLFWASSAQRTWLIAPPPPRSQPPFQ